MSPAAVPPARTRWRAVLLGAVSGLFATLLCSLVAYIAAALVYRTGWDQDNMASWTGLSLSLFAGQFLAGYAGGRLSGGPYAGAHGGMAAAGCYAVFAAVSLLGGSPAGVGTLLFFGAAAVAIGLGGGKLAGRRFRRRPETAGEDAESRLPVLPPPE